jgi:wobble nucleotide-excising tRNase
MQLIAEQVRNGQISASDAVRMAADKCTPGGAMETILRCAESEFQAIDELEKEIEDLEEESINNLNRINDLEMEIAALKEELDKK